MQFRLFDFKSVCVATGLTIALGYFLSPGELNTVGYVWAGYVLTFSVASIIRLGLLGYIWTNVAVLSMAAFHGAEISTLVASLWLICSAVYASKLMLNLAYKWILHAVWKIRSKWASRKHEMRPVAIAVEGSVQEISAAAILARHGFEVD